MERELVERISTPKSAYGRGVKARKKMEGEMEEEEEEEVEEEEEGGEEKNSKRIINV